MSRCLALFLSLGIASSAAAQGPARFQAYAEPMPVPDFTLQAPGGDEVRARDLLGKIWVAQFFYPGCNLCIRNMPSMEKLHETYRNKSDVRLVSLDLHGSSLKTLEEFAEYKKADPEKWLFLTGPKERVHDLARFGFLNMVFPNKYPEPGNAVTHTTHLVLVDHQGQMLGYVDGVEPDAADALKAEIDRLRLRRRLEQPIPVRGDALPYFNALLNSTCTVLLLLGWIAIRLRYETLHKLIMLLALAVSMTFLASYLFYHFVVMEMEPMRFPGQGPARWLYFTILLSHTILAILVTPLALTITVQGLRDARKIHVKLARWTLPMWLYVSVTGVVVYWMLYRVEW